MLEGKADKVRCCVKGKKEKLIPYFEFENNIDHHSIPLVLCYLAFPNCEEKYFRHIAFNLKSNEMKYNEIYQKCRKSAENFVR